MDKINFQNGVTKLNKDTFDTFQNNIDTAKAEQSDLESLTSKVNTMETSVTEQLLDIKSDISELQVKETLLYSGNATAGQTITLNDDYTKYRFLYIVNGTSEQNWSGAMIGTTVNSGTEIYFIKGYLNVNKSSQIHIANLRRVSNTQLQVVECGYKVLTGNDGSASNTPFVSSNVKKIYGSL